MGQLVYTYFPTASLFFLIYIYMSAFVNNIIKRLHSSFTMQWWIQNGPVNFANYKKSP